MIDYKTVKPLLFRLDPESAHSIASGYLKAVSAMPFLHKKFLQSNFVNAPELTQDLFGVKFANPIGLGAGFDKNATLIDGTEALGFGFCEIGTVTPMPQDGNPKPRMFRHVDEQSLQNAMGFNNDGLFKVQQRLKRAYPAQIPLGINIGKNKNTPQKSALDDYDKLIRALHNLGDYLVINISSPNTPGLRDLQNEQFIRALFERSKSVTTKPILLKIAPDMSANEAIDLCSFAIESGADGIIATNTTIDYSLVKSPKEIGGLSGAVLKEKSFELFEAISKELFSKTTLISVGGIDSAQEAYRRIKAGASLVQIYTALIFKGDRLIGDINRSLIELIRADGYNNITEAIGADRR